MKAKAEAPLLLTVREVAKLLRVQRPKVYDLIRDGAIDGFKVGADWRIRKDSVENLIGAIPEDFFKGRRSMVEAAGHVEAAVLNEQRPTVID